MSLTLTRPTRGVEQRCAGAGFASESAHRTSDCLSSFSTQPVSQPVGERRRLLGTRLIAGALLGGLALIAVHLALLGSYWNSEEGIYALTARLLLSGHELYRQTVSAQPPGTYLVGAGLLAIHDSLEWLRVAVAGLQLTAGLLAGQIVWRTTGSAAASVATPAIMLLTPWAVHEHGTLTPELVSLPFLLGALLTCRRRRTVVVAGSLCGCLPLVKLPYALPALVIILSSDDVRRASRWAVGAFAAGLVATILLGGDALWKETVIAQTQSGTHSLQAVKGWWLQAAWNLSGLVLCCLLALRFRERANDWGQLRAVLNASVALSITLLSVVKNGTSLNVTVPIEAVLVPGAVSGLVLAWRAAHAEGARQWAAGLAVAALIFTFAQSASLIISPTDPNPFLRVGSSHVGWSVILTGPQFRSAVTAARACAGASVYGGPPLIAFAAGRRVPDDQPDAFITTTPVLRAVLKRMQDARTICRY
jgi:hypothetical protein